MIAIVDSRPNITTTASNSTNEKPFSLFSLFMCLLLITLLTLVPILFFYRLLLKLNKLHFE